MRNLNHDHLSKFSQGCPTNTVLGEAEHILDMICFTSEDFRKGREGTGVESSIQVLW